MKKIYLFIIYMIFFTSTVFSSPYVIKLGSYSNKVSLQEKISYLDNSIQKNVNIHYVNKIFNAYTTRFKNKALAQKQLPLYKAVFLDAYVTSKTPIEGLQKHPMMLQQKMYQNTQSSQATIDTPYIIKMASYSNMNSLLVEVAKLDSSIRTHFEIHTINNTHVAYSTPFASRVLAQRKLFLYKKVFKDAYITNHIPTNNAHTAKTKVSHELSTHMSKHPKDKTSFVIKLASYTHEGNLHHQISKLHPSVNNNVQIKHINNIYSAYSTPFMTRALAQNQLSTYKRVFPDAYVMSHMHLRKKVSSNPVKLYQGKSYNTHLKTAKEETSHFTIKLAAYSHQENLMSEISKLDGTLQKTVKVTQSGTTFSAYTTSFPNRVLAQKKLVLYKGVFSDAYVSSKIPNFNQPRSHARIADIKNPHIWTIDPLEFKQSKKVYHAYGTSQMHGMTIYLSKKRGEVRVKDVKAYLIASSPNLENWYKNYYLKDKQRSSLKPLSVSYINTTHVNAEKKFTFFGIPKGDYFVIIESNYPTSFRKKKKIYIAKKFKVEDYKKLIVLFSKAI